jgi:RimJ/RimL family protein N-acetyltransferase
VRLETARLILRPWEERDREPFAEIVGDPVVRRFFAQTLAPDEASAYIDHMVEAARNHGFHMQAAELKADGALVGLIGIGHIPEATRGAIPGHPEVEIGWVLAQRFWGQGLAPEGARAWLDHAWSIGLPEVVAFTAAINEPSQRVMEKIGMARDPDGDFLHPRIGEGHTLRRHVLYRIFNPGERPRSGSTLSDR